jgi:hypothetical protein
VCEAQQKHLAAAAAAAAVVTMLLLVLPPNSLCGAPRFFESEKQEKTHTLSLFY